MPDEVILEGSVFANPIAGREAVRNALRQSTSIYDRLECSRRPWLTASNRATQPTSSLACPPAVIR